MHSQRASRERGITLIEALVALGILAIIAAVGLPNLTGALQRARARGAADTLAVAIRDARARAIATGWQFRVFGFNDASGTRKNQFRIEGRSTTATPWPAPSAAGPITTGTQTADSWTDLAGEYAGARLNVGDGGACPDALGTAASSFCIEYNSQGLLVNSYAGPGGALQVADKGGNVYKNLAPTVAGAVRVY